MLLTWVQLIVGVVVLYFGAAWLVKGAASLASALGLRQIIIGLTVVAYGTSAPELTVGVAAANGGQGALALGNSIGSNICNIGLILGLTALIAPPRTDGSLIRREVPMLLFATAMVPLLLIDGVISRLDGAVLLAFAIIYSVAMVRGTVRSEAGHPEAMAAAAEGAGAPPGRGKVMAVVIAVVGLVLLIGGGKVFVDAAVALARAAGISERVVGLTIVAVGTSLPELATSLIAATRGHADLAIGNVVGSNIFNVFLILGVAALVRPIPAVLGDLTLDLIALGLFTVVAAIALRTARRVTRAEGAMLVLGYAAFLIALVFTPGS